MTYRRFIGAAALFTLGFAGVASAQQKAAAPAGPPPSAWVKLCEKAPFISQAKDGKETKEDREICLTHHERLDGNTGMVLVSAAIRQIEKAPARHFMVMVPLGMALPPGLQVGVYPKDMWDKVEKGEKVDDSKLKPIKLNYTLCHAAGCTAEAELTAEMETEMKGGAGAIVFALNGAGLPIALPVPLTGFSEALAGAPIDPKIYGDARKELMKQLAKRQQDLIEKYRKEQDELKNMTGQPPATGATPAKAAPAPAPKK